MKAWSVVEFSKPLELLERPTPQPAGTEILLEVQHCGICHSDLHFWHGRYDLGGGKFVRLEDRGVTLPAAPGHEVVGRVTAIGPDAEGVRVGDLRLVFPWIGCGRCKRCHEGDDNLCTAQASVGIVRSGGFGSHVLVPHPRYLLDFGPVDPAFAATLACSGLTAYAALAQVGPLEPDEPVLVLGAGGLGLAAIALLRAMGHHDNIIVLDVDPSKLAAADALGAAQCFDASQGDLVSRIQAAAGQPIRAALDFVGISQTAQLGYDALTKGGTLALVGVGGGEITLSITGTVMGAKTVVGSNTGTVAQLQAVVDLARTGKLQSIPITQLPAAQVNDALIKLEHGEITGRIVLQGPA